jgi:hypothetical protein
MDKIESQGDGEHMLQTMVHEKKNEVEMTYAS